MSFYRVLSSNFSKLLFTKNSLKLGELRSVANTGHLLIQERFFRKSFGRILRVMRLRRKLAGPERKRKRNEWDNWNYNTELYAFNKRLLENMTNDTLRCAFINDSYIQSEEQKRRELDIPIQEASLDLKSNSTLMLAGRKIASNFLKRYLRHCFQLLPEEGINAVHDHLLSEKVLAHVSFHIGTKDLILSAEYPPNKSTLANTLLAIIGSIGYDDSISRAEKFVLDFICMQLIGKDFFEMWDLQNPSQVLNSILKNHSMSEYEPRLIFESGRNSIEAIYHVGIYSDKQFLGRAAGETLEIAEELAVYDCLRKFFHIKESEQPIATKLLNQEELSNEIDKNPGMENWFYEPLKTQRF